MLANLNLMRQFVNRFQPRQRPPASQQMPQQNMAAGGMLAPGLGMQAAMQQQYGAPGQTPMGIMAALARAQQAQPGAMQPGGGLANAFAQMQAGQGQGMLGGMQAPQGMGNLLAQMMMARQQQGAQQGMGMGGLGMMGAGMFGGRNRR